MTTDIRTQVRNDRRALQGGAVAAALQSAPPEGITRKELARAADCTTWDTVEPVGLLVHAGAVAEPSPGCYAPVPGADIPAALTAVLTELRRAEEKAEEAAMIASAEGSLDRCLRRLRGEEGRQR